MQDGRFGTLEVAVEFYDQPALFTRIRNETAETPGETGMWSRESPRQT